MKKPKNAPVPEEEDTSDSPDDDQLYVDKMLPEDKISLKKLQTSIKRIKQQDLDRITFKARKGRLKKQRRTDYADN